MIGFLITTDNFSLQRNILLHEHWKLCFVLYRIGQYSQNHTPTLRSSQAKHQRLIDRSNTQAYTRMLERLSPIRVGETRAAYWCGSQTTNTVWHTKTSKMRIAIKNGNKTYEHPIRFKRTHLATFCFIHISVPQHEWKQSKRTEQTLFQLDRCSFISQHLAIHLPAIGR